MTNHFSLYGLELHDKYPLLRLEIPAYGNYPGYDN